MRITRRSILWAALLVLGLAVCARPVRADGYDADALQADLDSISELGATRVHALLTVGEDEPVEAVSGADTEGEGGPVSEFYVIGSNVETFVAAVVLQLAGEGTVSLDDPVERILPGIVTGAYDGAAITIRQLLQHTSGIPDLPATEQSMPDATPAAHAADLVRGAFDRPAVFAPGTAWAFSRTDYLLVGMVIEAATGNAWDQEVQSRIIEPLGLEQTTAGANSEIPDPNRSLTSTPENLTRFFDALLGGELLAPDLRAEMLNTVETNRGDGSRFGLGLEWRPLSCGGGYWGQRSTLSGYRSNVGITEDGLRRIVLSNATVSVDPAADLAQEEASLALVERALCGVNRGP